MSEDPSDFLYLSDQAMEDLEGMESAEVSLRALYNRLYYSVFYAAKAALLSLGEEPKTHRGTASQLYQLVFEDEEEIDRSQAIIIQKLQEKRDMADYEVELDFDEKDFEEDRENAEEFIDEMKRICREND